MWFLTRGWVGGGRGQLEVGFSKRLPGTPFPRVLNLPEFMRSFQVVSGGSGMGIGEVGLLERGRYGPVSSGKGGLDQHIKWAWYAGKEHVIE